MSSHELIFSPGAVMTPFLMLASLRPCGAPLASTSAVAPMTPAAPAATATPLARMNSRRLRYSFLSVISELRTSDGGLISIQPFYLVIWLSRYLVNCDARDQPT